MPEAGSERPERLRVRVGTSWSGNSSRRVLAEPYGAPSHTHEAPTCSPIRYREYKQRSQLQLVLEVYMNARALVCTAIGIALGSLTNAYAEQPPSPCHP